MLNTTHDPSIPQDASVSTSSGCESAAGGGVLACFFELPSFPPGRSVWRRRPVQRAMVDVNACWPNLGERRGATRDGAVGVGVAEQG